MVDHGHRRLTPTTGPRTSGEAWPFLRLNDPAVKHPCSNANLNVEHKPTFLHVAQRYDSHQWPMFHKGHVPPNILQCELPLIIEPPEDLIDSVPVEHVEQRHKNYMLCSAYKLINSAVLDFKRAHCPAGFNQDKEIRLQKKDQQCRPEDKGKSCWVFATWDRKLEGTGFKIRLPSS